MTPAFAVPSRFPLLWHLTLLNSVYYRLTFLLAKYVLKLTIGDRLGKKAFCGVATEATHFGRPV